MTRDFEKEIFEVLISGPLSKAQIYRKLGGDRTKIFQTVNDLIEDGPLIQHKVGTNDMVSISPTDFDKEHNLLVQSMELYKETLENSHLKRLRKLKPIFKIQVDKEHEFGFWINPKSREILNNIVLLLDQILQFSVSLTYQEHLDLIPKRHKQKIKDDQRLCFRTIQYIMKKLLIVVDRKNKKALKCYIDYKSIPLRKVQFKI